jgi:signal transduction histidine kinase
VTMLVPPERFDEELVLLERVRRGDPIEHYETVRLRKGGRPINLSLTVSPIRNGQGQVVGASKIARDITDRKNAEKALHQSQALLADRAGHLEQLVAERTTRLRDTISELEHFSYTITHDMRAPLRAMQGFGGMLLSESRDRLTPESGDYLRRIVEGARRMDALIQDSLQYAKIIRERIPLEPIEPAPVLRGILETYPTLQSPKAEIELVEPFPPICANESGLAQCFSNLLANAIKFVKPGKVPHVRVWAEARGDLVRFWFEDNGIGIPPEYHERIFEMFHQLDKSYEGTGIGLALVRKTAERMDGKVGVESELGKGSRFWLEFRRPKP